MGSVEVGLKPRALDLWAGWGVHSQKTSGGGSLVSRYGSGPPNGPRISCGDLLVWTLFKVPLIRSVRQLHVLLGGTSSAELGKQGQ